MNFLVVGAGQIGGGIAKNLSLEENDVSVVDCSPIAIKKISEKLDVKAIVGSGSDPLILKEAGVSEADMIIAVSSSCEANIVACQIANFAYGIETKIAKISDVQYRNHKNLFGKNGFDIDLVVSPEMETIDAIVKNITVHGMYDLIKYSDDMLIASVTCSHRSQILNTSLLILPSVLKNIDIVILFIERDNTCIIPTKSDTVMNGDIVHFAIKAQKLDVALEIFGYDSDSVNEVVLIGGGNIALNIAKYISNSNSEINVKLIEKNLKKAEFLSENLKNAEIVYGDALNAEIFEAANIKHSDCVISVTDDDKTNVIACLLAKKYGAKRVASLLNDIFYSEIIQSIGIDTIIDPRRESILKILKFIKKGSIELIKTSPDGAVHMVSIEVFVDSYAVGSLIDSILIRGEIQAAILIRGSDVYILPRNLIIDTGDKILFISKNTSVKKLEKFFSSKPKYLI